MQDGQNLFFPAEAFLGHDWAVDKTGDVLRAMNAVEDFIVLGIYSSDRMSEYTKPGYEWYARSLVEEVVPEVERRGFVEAGTEVPLRLGLFARRCRLVLHGLAVPQRVRHRRLHVEHLFPSGRPHRPRILGAVQGRGLLPG